MEKYSFKEGSSVPDKDGKHDHMADAIRYYVDYDFSIKRDVVHTEQQRWGVATR